MKKLLTLCIIYKDDKILLGMKKRGLGTGRWNGFGGHIKKGESIEESVTREISEETGLSVKNLKKMGIIIFEFQDGHQNLEVHIFRSKDFEGRVTESEEMRPEWFDASKLPLKDMWPADTYWLPILLRGKKFEGKFIYDHPSTSNNASNIIEKALREVN